MAIKNLGRGVINDIVKERENGKYKSLYDMCRRLAGTELNKRAVEALIKSGALDSLGHTRRSMFMCYENILSKLSAHRSLNVEGQIDMFGSSENDSEGDLEEDFVMPTAEEFKPAQLLQMEKESAGFYITGHPVDRYEGLKRRLGCKSIYSLISSAKEGINGFRDGQRQPLVAMLTAKKQHMQKNGKLMCFAEFEDRSGSIEGIIFSDIYEKYSSSLNEGNIYKMVGTISSGGSFREEEDPKLIINSLELAAEIQNSSKILYIKLSSESSDKTESVCRLLWEAKGDMPVKLCFEDTRRSARPKGIKGVKNDEELFKRLEDICGKGSIIVK